MCCTTLHCVVALFDVLVNNGSPTERVGELRLGMTAFLASLESCCATCCESQRAISDFPRRSHEVKQWITIDGGFFIGVHFETDWVVNFHKTDGQ